MNAMAITKALSNETRYKILKWLKKPEQHFGLQSHLPRDCDFAGGICVGDIQEKAGLAQSVISGYLATLQNAGLLESKRLGQWTYYRRNEKNIAAFIAHLAQDL